MVYAYTAENIIHLDDFATAKSQKNGVLRSEFWVLRAEDGVLRSAF